jgi:hypothetical protein
MSTDKLLIRQAPRPLEALGLGRCDRRAIPPDGSGERQGPPAAALPIDVFQLLGGDDVAVPAPEAALFCAPRNTGSQYTVRRGLTPRHCTVPARCRHIQNSSRYSLDIFAGRPGKPDRMFGHAPAVLHKPSRSKRARGEYASSFSPSKFPGRPASGATNETPSPAPTCFSSAWSIS